jgi:hypothetical protein
MSGTSPLLQAARFWERAGGKGTRYMQGRLGGVKVVILPNPGFRHGRSGQQPQAYDVLPEWFDAAAEAG